MRKFYYIFLLWSYCHQALSFPGLYIDDQELTPTQPNQYSYNGQQFTFQRTGEQVSLFCPIGEIKLTKQRSPRVTPPYGDLPPRERIAALIDKTFSYVEECIWQVRGATDRVLRELGFKTVTFKYMTQDVISARYEGPHVSHGERGTDITMNLLSVDNERVLGVVHLGQVPFNETPTPLPNLRFVTRTGTFQGVVSVSQKPNVEELKTTYGVEVPDKELKEYRTHSCIHNPVLGDFAPYSGGYVKVTEVHRRFPQRHPLHIYFDAGGNARAVQYQYWKVKKEGEEGDEAELTSLHGTDLLLDLFDNHTVVGTPVPGKYYELPPSTEIEGITRTTLDQVLGTNQVHFDRQSSESGLVHHVDLSHGDTSTESLQALVYFAKHVKQPTQIYYRPPKAMGIPELEQHGDFIHQFLEEFKKAFCFFRKVWATSSGIVSRPLLDVDQLSISSRHKIDLITLFRYTEAGVKEIYPAWVECCSCPSLHTYYTQTNPVRLTFEASISESKKIANLERLISGFGRLRDIRMANSLEKADFGSKDFRKFAQALVKSPVERVQVDNFVTGRWEKAGLSQPQLQRFTSCLWNVKIITLTAVKLPEKDQFRELLSRSKETLEKLTLTRVSGFSEGHMEPFISGLRACGKLTKLSIENMWFTNGQTSLINSALNQCELEYTANKLGRWLYTMWHFTCLVVSERQGAIPLLLPSLTLTNSKAGESNAA